MNDFFSNLSNVVGLVNFITTFITDFYDNPPQTDIRVSRPNKIRTEIGIPSHTQIEDEVQQFASNILSEMNTSHASHLSVLLWRCQSWHSLKNSFDEILKDNLLNPTVGEWAFAWIERIDQLEKAAQSCEKAFQQKVQNDPSYDPTNYQIAFDQIYAPVRELLQGIKNVLAEESLQYNQLDPYKSVLGWIEKYWEPLTLFAKEPEISFLKEGVMGTFETETCEKETCLSLLNPALIKLKRSPSSGQVNIEEQMLADLIDVREEEEVTKIYIAALGNALSTSSSNAIS